MAWFEHPSARVYYEDAGAGQAVLLLPGFSLKVEDLSSIKEALIPNYRVISADLPGSGRSGPQPREYTRNYHTDDARVLVGLLEGLGIDQAHVIGHSDGGESALAMAALDPGRIQSVLTWGALGYIDPSLLQLVGVFEVVVDEPIESLQQYSNYLKTTYGEDNARAMVKSFSNAIREIVADGGDIARSRVSDIVCPVLLITGDHDPFAPPAFLSQFAAMMPNAEMHNLTDAGHDLHRTHTKWLVETALGWLAEH